MANQLEAMRKEILNGKGFILFKGFPVQAWGNHKSAVAYMGLGTYLGYFVSQNGLGHVLGHVKVRQDTKQHSSDRAVTNNVVPRTPAPTQHKSTKSASTEPPPANSSTPTIAMS